MRALVVDDSRTMRRIVAGTLQNLGFETSEAEDGQAAIDLLESGLEADLACVDWNMPVMNGLEMVTRVRATRAWRAMTLMMVTTESEQSQIVRALAAGAHEYLIKPFSPDALRDKLILLGLLHVPPPDASGDEAAALATGGAA
jgi:two-component system, chemotaxis family, chemotaxis protein CheY